MIAIDALRPRVERVAVGTLVAAIHPQLFRARLGRECHIIEYQVRQLPRGVEVCIRAQGPTDLEQIRSDLTASLSQAGLEQPSVLVRKQASFERTAAGKFKRFIPLDGVEERQDPALAAAIPSS